MRTSEQVHCSETICSHLLKKYSRAAGVRNQVKNVDAIIYCEEVSVEVDARDEMMDGGKLDYVSEVR